MTYFITSIVDLNGDRLIAGQNTVLIGGSSKNCGLKSTGLVVTNSEMYASTGPNNRVEGIAIQTIIDLSESNYIELWVENATDNTDVIVTFLNVIVEVLN